MKYSDIPATKRAVPGKGTNRACRQLTVVKLCCQMSLCQTQEMTYGFPSTLTSELWSGRPGEKGFYCDDHVIHFSVGLMLEPTTHFL